MNRNFKSKEEILPIEVLKGVFRRTLLYNDALMLCHFTLDEDAEIPMHSHKEHQVGYVIKGKIKFFTENNEFLAKKGDSYIFDSEEKHGAKIIEKAEVIDIFNPSREDYK